MADDIFDSEGSELYLSLDGTTVTAFDCPTGMNGFGFTSAERDSSCLNEAVGKSKPGKRKLNNPTIPFRVTRGSDAHQFLLGLAEEGSANPEILYAVGFSDGTADPTISAGAFVAPGTAPNYTRSFILGSCYVSAVSFDFAEGQDVLGSFTFMPQSQANFWKPVS